MVVTLSSFSSPEALKAVVVTAMAASDHDTYISVITFPF